ncbi:hypothetical protein GARC_3540 [Paraglaciecola arctica BSs20135]|uniref:Uncharacterized protein n=1 Tax=Paraglaciecola arctica BSs20135 TaxID=493475 RepID=K6XIL3_9ALTE|nr:hypothetical protein GARC_3540 [Paraglaciecola arctica BSs20135]
MLASVRWGDQHMSDERGIPVAHINKGAKGCGAVMHPVTVCSCLIVGN